MIFEISNNNLSLLTNTVNKSITIDPEKSFIENMRGEQLKAPYSYLADRNGYIHHNGVTFYCNPKTNSINLGDTSDPRNYINVSLENGGLLKVNRDNFEDLAKAIDMFSPADRNAIMRAIARDTQIQRWRKEMDEEEEKAWQEGEEIEGHQNVGELSALWEKTQAQVQTKSLRDVLLLMVTSNNEKTSNEQNEIRSHRYYSK